MYLSARTTGPLANMRHSACLWEELTNLKNAEGLKEDQGRNDQRIINAKRHSFSLACSCVYANEPNLQVPSHPRMPKQLLRGPPILRPPLQHAPHKLQELFFLLSI